MQTIYFAGKPGSGYGWGVCNQHLYDELSRRAPVELIGPQDSAWRSPHLPGDLFTPMADHHFEPATPARGKRNFAYTFFESELTGRAVVNAQRFDRIFAGCSWCCQRMLERGIQNGVCLVQGVDTLLFSPGPPRPDDGRFVIFSGGKFELRKGQDLVLRAVKILQEKYADIHLVTSWFNHWPASMRTMASSRLVRYEETPGSWHEQMRHLYTINGLDPARIITMPLLSREKTARVYQLTDVGLFPNRCEGGTNLVLMEYMACGKPVIATDATGHRDVVHDRNALLLRDLRPFNVPGPDGRYSARWVTPTLEEIVERVEHAYHNRDAVRQLGLQAAQDMVPLTWERTARKVLETMQACS